MKYEKPFLDEIRERTDIVAFLENHGVALRVSGANIMGLCPFHSERTPSFHVNAVAGRYHCFGCGESGDVIDLAIALEHLTFPGAVQYLAEKANIPLPTNSKDDDDSYRKRKRQYEMCRLAANYFRKNFLSLPEDHPAKQNFAERNLLPQAEGDMIVGYAPPTGLTTALQHAGYKDKEIIDAGLATQYINPNTGKTSPIRDKFRHRIMWTICDTQGKPIAFSGRKLENDDDRVAKYVNSPETILYSKRHALLGLSQAKEEILNRREVIIVEGQTDVMAVKAAGNPNVVASCGTAFGPDHANLLLKLASARKGQQAQPLTFILCMDGDNAGRGAVLKAFQHIPDLQLQTVVVDWEDLIGDKKTDPCDYRLEYGDAGLNEALSHNVSLIEFLLKQALKEHPTNTPESRAEFVNTVQPLLSAVRDSLTANEYKRKIAYWTGIPYADLINFNTGSRPAPNLQPARANTIEALASVDDKLVAAFLQYPEEMQELFIESELDRTVFENPDRLTAILDDEKQKDVLLFHDLKIPEGREKDALRRMLNAYLHTRYTTELQNLTASMRTSDEGDLTHHMETLMEKQQELKTRFHIQ